MKKNPVSPIMTSKCLRLEIIFCCELFTCLRRSQCVLVSRASGVVFMAGHVYAVGGFNGSLRVRTVDVYDGVKDQWTSIASMQERRSTLGAAVLNDLLYAVGGFDGSTGRSWTRSPPVPAWDTPSITLVCSTSSWANPSVHPYLLPQEHTHPFSQLGCQS